MNTFLNVFGLDRKEAKSLQSGLFTMVLSAFVTVAFYMLGLAVISHFNTVSGQASEISQSSKIESKAL